MRWLYTRWLECKLAWLSVKVVRLRHELKLLRDE